MVSVSAGLSPSWFKVRCIDLLWLGDTIWWQISVNIGSGNDLLPDSTKPLPEPMLTDHQWGLVAFTWEQFHKCLWTLICNMCSEITFLKITAASPRGQWVKLLKSGGWFNIKMPSYQYRKSHCGDKTILRPSYLHNGISYTGKTTSLYWIRAQVIWYSIRILQWPRKRLHHTGTNLSAWPLAGYHQ